MLRALPSIAAALLIAGLLGAVVAAAPSRDESPRARAGDAPAGPFAVMRQRPTELSAELDEFKPPPAERPRKSARPPLEPIGELSPKRQAGRSRAIGKPWSGRLAAGVELPARGVGYFTFDSALRVSPSRAWRRWGTAATVSRTLAVLDDFAAANPGAPRIGVGDLSRPRGGIFDGRYGGLGHASHQNGLDVDLYYPRRDRRLRPPSKPSQVDRRLAQDLVDRLVAAGAELVFVGPSLDLRGPRAIVRPLANHDDHVHVRWPRR